MPGDWQQQEFGYTAGAYNIGYEYDGLYTVFHAYPQRIQWLTKI